MSEHHLGSLDDLEDGQMRAFEDIGEYGIVVCRVDGTLHAVIDNCSHADAPLSEGRFRGRTLVCPVHGAAFNVTTGEHSGPPAWEGIDCYPVVEDDDGVRVTLAAADDENVGGFDAGSPRTR
ncbi:MAG: Rieske 2Fe-2S domain-containing protein [Actinomycetota bacterium]